MPAGSGILDPPEPFAQRDGIAEKGVQRPLGGIIAPQHLKRRPNSSRRHKLHSITAVQVTSFQVYAGLFHDWKIWLPKCEAERGLLAPRYSSAISL